MIRSFKIIAFNQFIVVPLFTYANIYVKGVLIRTDYESLPTVLEAIWQIYFFIFVEDFLFYWSHRFLHWNVIYPYIHKIHHEYKNTISIATENVHPIEFILANIAPVNFPILILQKRVHLLTHSMWIWVRVFKATDAHSGYNNPFVPNVPLPKKIPSQYHNFHHLQFVNNYGSFMRFWDDLCGTVAPKYAEFLKQNKYE